MHNPIGAGDVELEAYDDGSIKLLVLFAGLRVVCRLHQLLNA